MNGPSRLLRDPRAMLGALVFTLYAGVSQGVLNLYPFSTFDMYSRRESSASRLGVRTADGTVVEVSRFTGYHCDGAIDVSPRLCGGYPRFSYTPYKDDELADYVRTHAGAGSSPGAEPVEIVRRIFRLGAEGPPRTEDCVLVSCSAVKP